MHSSDAPPRGWDSDSGSLTGDQQEKRVRKGAGRQKEAGFLLGWGLGAGWGLKRTLAPIKGHVYFVVKTVK